MGILIKMDRACCGCTVRSLSLFFLYVTLIFMGLTFLSKISGGGDDAKGHKGGATPGSLEEMIIPKTTAGGRDDENTRQLKEVAHKVSRVVTMYTYLNEIVSFILTAACLYGIHVERAQFMVPYLFYSGFILALYFVLLSLFLIILLYITIAFHIAIHVFFVTTFFVALFWGLSYYILLIIYNAYRQIKERAEQHGSVKYNT